MSLITSCPACGTMFKVVADQLRISEGWVRCGHCAEIFDATAHMLDEARASAAPPQERLAPPAPSSMPVQVEAAAAAPVVTETPFSPAAVVSEEAPGYPPFELRRADFGDDVVAPARDADSEPSLVSASSGGDWRESELPHDPPPLERPLQDLGFVRDAQRKAFWRRPGVRVLLALFALLLGASLAAQWAVHERDRLAAMRPQLAPVLQLLCKPLACTLGPLRRIEAVTIDSSAFTKLRPDLYRLSLTLKNHSAPPVAFPALELTLTDTQDQPVLRRVLGPQELGAAAQTIAGNGEWAGTVTVAVSANGGAARVAGYRLLAFYP